MKSAVRLSIPVLALSGLSWSSPLAADVLPDAGASSDTAAPQTLVFRREPKITRGLIVTLTDSTIGKVDKPDAMIGFHWGHFRMTSSERSSSNYRFIEKTIQQDANSTTTQVQLKTASLEAWKQSQGGIYREDGEADQKVNGKPLHKKIELQAGTLTFASNYDGPDLWFSFASGRLTGTINGIPAPASYLKQGEATMRKLGVPTSAFKPITFRFQPTGDVVRSDASGLQGFDAFSIQYLLRLPKEPVAVGASWESTQKASLGDLFEEKGNMQGPAVEVTLTHTLTALEIKNGRQFAIIRTEGVLPLAEAAKSPAGLSDLTFEGRGRVDVERGVLVSGDYEFKVDSSRTVTEGINDDLKGCTINVEFVRHTVVREVPLPPSKQVRAAGSSRTSHSKAAKRAPH